MLQNGKNYLGIDLSPAQITLARTEFKTNNDSFQIAEMLEFCNTAESNTFGGIIALFSIFHLPRKHHVDLFEQIKRILMPGAPFLFTCSPSSGEGVSSNWLQADTMYWSNFSNRWYEQTLNELQFHPVMKYR